MNEMNFAAHPVEIERKFLVAYPDKKFIDSLSKESRSEIFQTYLISNAGITARVRKRIYADGVKYYRTEKRRITNMSCLEDECELTEKEYEMELEFRDPSRQTVSKTRYLIESGKYTFELDLYPFWEDRAILEIELESEDDKFDFPSGIHIIREVTDDKRYKNAALALEIPYDNIN